MIFWSGAVEDDGKGPVEKGAHFYKSLQMDGNGNVINKRNAWSTRSVVYVRLIPPGAADTVHYRLQIPETAGDSITLKARLNYRKFQWMEHAVRLRRRARSAVTRPRSTQDYDNRRIHLHGATRHGVGQGQADPRPADRRRLVERGVAARAAEDGAGARAEGGAQAGGLDALERLRHRLPAAGRSEARARRHSRASRRSTPKNPDGWVNIGRVRVQEGNVAGAREVLERALALAPDLARANYFMSRVREGGGQAAEASSRRCRRSSRNTRSDRVVRNDAGRNLFLLRRYREAIEQFEQALAIDPEDLQAHYNLMLCYNGIGDAGAIEGAPGTLSALQGRRVGAGDHRPVSAQEPRRQQRAPVHPRAPGCGPLARRRRRRVATSAAACSGAGPCDEARRQRAGRLARPGHRRKLGLNRGLSPVHTGH